MSRLRIAALSAFTLTCLAGCKQPEANPEQRDPIFKDLEARATAHAKTATEARTSLAGLTESLAKAEVNSIDKKQIEKDLAKTRITLRNAEQWAHYYEIRSARRKVEAKISYRRAFDANQPWPPKSEWAEYQVNRQLVESPRDWNVRVPKMSSRGVAGKPAPKGGHGGGEPKKSGH